MCVVKAGLQNKEGDTGIALTEFPCPASLPARGRKYLVNVNAKYMLMYNCKQQTNSGFPFPIQVD